LSVVEVLEWDGIGWGTYNSLGGLSEVAKNETEGLGEEVVDE